MEEMNEIKIIKKVPLKVKKVFYGSIIQSVLISFLMMIIFTVIVFFLLWSRRMEIVNFLVKEYKSQQEVSTPIDISLIDEKKVDEKPTIVIQEEKQTESPSVVEAVKKAKPAVVSVVVKKEDTDKKVNSGSGFLISADGLIVTNRHVVSSMDATFTVLLNDGKEYVAQILDKDPILDIALIKIEEKNLPYLEFADSDILDVGETVIAIGNALGKFENTVSVGVISGLSRTLLAGDNAGQIEFLDQVIQTDAAINKGNSGGPLLNIFGDVVGINVAVVEKSASIGFSLPINSVKDVIDSVRKTGKIIRPFVGVRYVMISSDLSKEENLPFDYGIWIQRGDEEDELAIIPNSPAEKAGLKEGDIILEIDGKKIIKNDNFSSLIRGKKIGDILLVKVYSKGIIKTVVVVLEQAPSDL